MSDTASISLPMQHFEYAVIVLLKTILSNQEELMATQADLVKQLTAVKDELVKVGAETTNLVKAVADLQAVIANGPAVTPELQAAVDAVAAQAKVVDDLVPDAPAPAP